MDTPLEIGSLPSISLVSKKYDSDRNSVSTLNEQRDAGAFEEMQIAASVRSHDFRRFSGGY